MSGAFELLHIAAELFFFLFHDEQAGQANAEAFACHAGKQSRLPPCPERDEDGSAVVYHAARDGKAPEGE